MARPLVFVGDVLRAVHVLGITSPETAHEVMGLLGAQSWAAALMPVVAPAPSRPPNARPPDVVLPTLPEPPPPSVVTSNVPPDPTNTPAHVQAEITRIAAEARRPVWPNWAATTDPLPRAQRLPASVPDALLDPRQERALISGLASSVARDGVLDLPQLIGLLGHGRLVRELPRQRRAGLRRGVQVLADIGPGMAPFAPDVAQFIARLGTLVPPERIALLSFRGNPLRGCGEGDADPAPWQPPPAGTPVLLLTDLGLGARSQAPRGSSVDAWVEFTEAARAEGVTVRALVPYPRERWPQALAERLRAVHWDRRTSAAMVQRVLMQG